MVQKIFSFMTSRKALPVYAMLIIGGIFCLSASCKGSNNNNNDTLTKQQQLLVGIGYIIEQQHYAPKPIDDAFSQKIFDSFLSQLDGEKDIFLQSDIKELSQYRNSIDDEIHGQTAMKFYPAAVDIFKKRIAVLKPLYTKILSQPFNFSKPDMYQPIGDSLDYPADAAADTVAWQQRLKYRTLVAYNDLIAQKAKAKAGDSLSKKSNAALEKEARNSVESYYNRYFESKFNATTFSRTAQFSMFVNTITHEMDPHSDYFAPVDQRAFNEDMSNSFYGIGAQLQEKDGQIKIESVIVGGAAWKSKKIAAGDIILKVGDGKSPQIDLSGYAITDAIKLIRGAKDSKVVLTMKKASDGSIEDVSMIREKVNLDQAAAKSVIINDGKNKIGYLNLPEFYANFQDPKGARCAADVAKELQKLKAENINGLIIDLRFNPGGSLSDVNKMIGYFVNAGPAVQVRNRNNQQQELMDNDDADYKGVLYTGPLVVMVNEFSASASEIFAAAMQDYNRAIIVGSTSTYGKGTVQTQLPLGKPNENGEPEYGGLKLTVEKFYRINGGSTQMKGVSSDIVMPDLLESFNNREKDNPSALPWDKIAAAKYTAWNPTYNKETIIKDAVTRINENPVFKSIAKTNAWMSKNENKPIDLSIDKYRANQDSIQKMFNKDDNGAVLKTPLSVNVLKVDYDKYYKNPDKTKQGWYQDFLKSVSKDVYIEESTKIVSDMIDSGKQQTAAAK